MPKTETEVLTDIQTIARTTFRRPDLNLDRSSSANDVAEWDSMSHMRLIVGVEKHFKIKLTLVDLAGLENVGDLVDSVIKKAG